MKKLSYILLCGLMLILSACEKDTESSNFAPVVTTGSASNIYRMGATLSGSITLTETNTAKEYGILFSELESMAEYDEYPVKDGSTSYSVLIQNLEPGETYYYCAYASSGYSIAKSQIKSFTTTQSNAPVFNEVILQSKDEKSCAVSVELLDEGGSELLMTGFVWTEAGSGEPTIKSNVVNVEPQGSRMSATIKGMEPNKTYLLRAYAVNAQGVGYSNSISVTTNTATVPFLSDVLCVDSTEVSVTLKASVVDAGLGDVTKYGFCYSSESKNPTTDHLVAENIQGNTKEFSTLIENLNPETTYYFRAYAENEKGVGYSNVIEYTTKILAEPGIYTLDDLIAFRDARNASEDVSKWRNPEGIINLFADIDMSPVENWENISVLNEADIFEGNGHTISGLKMSVDLSKTYYSGFFGVNNGIIRDLIVDGNISITCPVDNGSFNNFGGFCGYNHGTVLNCIFKGQIVSTAVKNLACYIAGVVGFNDDGSIELCDNYGNISSDFNVSGICGYNSDGIIDECDNYGTITGKRDATGITEMNNRSKIINCINYGEIIADMVSGEYYPSASGIVGNNYQSVIENCINEGEVSAYNSSGICEYNEEDGVIRQCINKGVISATDSSSDASGINGTNHGVIDKCNNEGTVSGGNVSGGISNNNYATIMNCTNFGDVYVSSEGYYAAGIANRCSDYYREFVVEGCANSGNIMGGAKGAYIAGIISGIDASSGVYSNNINNGTVNGEPGTEDNAIGYDTRTGTSDETVNSEVALSSAGTLSSMLSEDEKYSITSLKVTGPLNGDDIRFIREMAGVDIYGNTTEGQLTILNIGEASIVEGGSSYRYGTEFTENDIIGDHMFDQTILKQVFLPDGVTSIGEWAFENCSSLTLIDIPDDVTSIGYGAFSNCSSLASIEIPNGVTSIGESAFMSCSSLNSIDIPEAVTSIGEQAFLYCTSLTSIDIPDGVTSIGRSTFLGCTALSSVTIGDGLTSIGDYAFEDCSFLTSIYIPDGVTSIGRSSFANCSSMTSINIPDGVTSIGNMAFHGCSSLVGVYISDLSAWCRIDFGDSSSNPFDYSNNGKLYLNNVEVTELVIPNDITAIKNNVFSGCSSLTSILLPDGVTLIGDYAFSECSSLASINIPDDVISIGYSAFSNCSSLTSINIPNGVTEIGGWTFWRCYSLTSIEIPDGVTSIGERAFQYCNLLSEVTCDATTPPTLGSNAFYDIASSPTLYVPISCSTAYSESDWAQYFTTIEEK